MEAKEIEIKNRITILLYQSKLGAHTTNAVMNEVNDLIKLNKQPKAEKERIKTEVL